MPAPDLLKEFKLKLDEVKRALPAATPRVYTSDEMKGLGIDLPDPEYLVRVGPDRRASFITPSDYVINDDETVFDPSGNLVDSFDDYRGVFGNVYAQSDIDQLTRYAATDPDAFDKFVLSRGREQTEPLLRRMFPSITDEQLSQLFPAPAEAVKGLGFGANPLSYDQFKQSYYRKQGAPEILTKYNAQTVPKGWSQEFIRETQAWEKQASAAYKEHQQQNQAPGLVEKFGRLADRYIPGARGVKDLFAKAFTTPIGPEQTKAVTALRQSLEALPPEQKFAKPVQDIIFQLGQHAAPEVMMREIAPLLAYGEEISKGGAAIITQPWYEGSYHSPEGLSGYLSGGQMREKYEAWEAPRGAKGGYEFLGGILLDPLNAVPVTGSVRLGVSAGARLAREAAEAVGESIAEQSMKRAPSFAEGGFKEMAPGTSAQPDMFGAPAQSKMMEEFGTAPGQGGAKQPLIEPPAGSKPLEGQAALPEESLVQEAQYTVSYPVSEIQVDPSRFQFKIMVDPKTGASSKLADVKYDPSLAGRVYGWMDKDGKVWIIEGHHRLDLAKRSGVNRIDISIDREADGITAEMARAKGALMNVATNQGTPVDVAKFLRDSGKDIEYLKEHNIPVSSRLAARGAAIAGLDDSLFQKVLVGQLDEDTAVAIGQGLPGDFANQRAVFAMIKDEDVSARELANLIKEAKNAGTTKVTQATLFGETVEEKSLLMARAKLRTFIEDELAKDKRIFTFVTRGDRPEALAKGGTTVDVARGQELAESSATAQAIFAAKVNAVGPINDTIADAAAQIASGGNLNVIRREALDRIRGTIQAGEYNLPSRRGAVPAGEPVGRPDVQKPQPAIQPAPEARPAPEVKPEAPPASQAPAEPPAVAPRPKPEPITGAATPEEAAGSFQELRQPEKAGEPVVGKATPEEARKAFEDIQTEPPEPPRKTPSSQELRTGISADMQNLYTSLQSTLKGYRAALKGKKGIEAEAARKTIRLLEDELKSVQNIIQTASDKAALATPETNQLKKLIATQKWYKGLPDKEFTALKQKLTGKSSLTEMTEAQLRNVLDEISRVRPVKIGNKEVITAQTEKALQDLNKTLVQKGHVDPDTLSEIQHYLKLPTDRYISGKLFISEAEGKQLIKALNQEAEVGLTKWKNQVRAAMLKSPSLGKAYKSIVARLQPSGSDPVGVSPWWDMAKYMNLLQQRAGGRIGDIWRQAYNRFLENGVALTNLDKELESLPNFKAIAANRQALRRINDYIASKNKWSNVEAPKNITAEEIAVAKKIEEQLLAFVDDVRYYRFSNAYNKFDGDLQQIAKEIPDAPLMDLNEAIRLYESQGADALSGFLKTKTWGVIESGYEPHIVTDVNRLQLYRVKSSIVGKGRLHAREGLEFDPDDLSILQRREKYIKQMLNLNLEPYFKAIDREFGAISPRLKDSASVSRNISQAFEELKGYRQGGEITRLLGKGQGYAFSVLALAPHMTFRNAMQNFLHPDLLAFVNPRNRKLSDLEKRFFDAFVTQEQGITKDYLLQERMPNTSLSRLVQRLSYYGKAETYANRLPSFWASMNKAERALESYRKTGNVDDFIKGSGLNELTPAEQQYALELLSQDTVDLGIEGLRQVDGGTAAAWEVARGITEKVHFNYIRAGRAPVEQGAEGRTWLSLATYPRNIATRLYEAGLTIKNGTPAEKLRAAKSVTSFMVGAIVADTIYEHTTGKSQDQYNPLQVLTYSVGGLAEGAATAISEPIETVVRAISGDKDAINQLPTQITRAADLFIPFYKPVMDVVDAAADQKNVDKEAVRQVRAVLDKAYKPDPESNDVEREWYEKVQKVLFGGGDQEEPENPQLAKLKSQWAKDFEAFEAVPADGSGEVTRDEYKIQNPQADARLFVAGESGSVKTMQAAAVAYQLIQENKLQVDDIKGLDMEKEIDPKKATPTDILMAQITGRVTPELKYRASYLALKDTWRPYEQAYDMLGQEGSRYYIADPDKRAAARAALFERNPKYQEARYRIKAYSEGIPEDQIDAEVEYDMAMYEYSQISLGDTYEANQKEAELKELYLRGNPGFRDEMYRRQALSADPEAPESIQDAYIRYYSITGEGQATRRKAFRRSDPEFEQWGEEYLGWKPLSTSSLSTAGIAYR